MRLGKTLVQITIQFYLHQLIHSQTFVIYHQVFLLTKKVGKVAKSFKSRRFGHRLVCQHTGMNLFGHGSDVFRNGAVRVINNKRLLLFNRLSTTSSSIKYPGLNFNSQKFSTPGQFMWTKTPSASISTLFTTMYMVPRTR